MMLTKKRQLLLAGEPVMRRLLRVVSSDPLRFSFAVEWSRMPAISNVSA
jgi:hypothetical protein